MRLGLHSFRCDVEEPVELVGRATGTKTRHADEAAVDAQIGVPALAHRGFDADPDTLQIVAVLNDHRNSEPGWRDWRVQYRAELTPEAKRWLENNGASKAKDQTPFAEFLEDNIADIQEPDAQDLLTVATTIQATTGIEFKSGRRLQDGQVQLQYVENIDAKAGANGALTIPKTFTLGLRLFKNGDGYRLTARLKYRLNGGSVKFWYELDRPERALEDAFGGYVERLRAESDYLVVLGAAG